MSAIELMLKDYVIELMLLFEDAKKRSVKGDDFEAGRKFGLMEAISLLQQQATTFGIPRTEINLPQEDIEKELP